MKTLLYTLLAMLALASCSKEEEVVTPPAPNKYTLAISAETGGTVSTEGGLYNEGSKITITATPDGMYLFKEWSDGSTQNPREITVTSNLTLKASFIKKTYPLAVTVEGEGTVQEEVIIQGTTTETEYNAGTTVRLTATPNEGWVFAGWSGDVESEDLVIEVKVEKGMTLIALFKELVLFVSKAESYSPINQTTGYYSKTSSFYRYLSLDEGRYLWQSSNGMLPNNIDAISYDFNSDGYLDLFLFVMDPAPWTYGGEGYHKNGKYWFISNYFNQSPPINIIEYSSIMEFASGGIDLQDLDGNGRKEIIIYNDNDHQFNSTYYANAGTPPDLLGIVILEVDENFNLLSEKVVGTPKNLHRGTSGDIDNDGDIDILNFPMGDPRHETRFQHFPTILYNSGNGSFTEELIFKDQSFEDYYNSLMALAVNFFDLNNDGYLDLIFGYRFGTPPEPAETFYGVNWFYYETGYTSPFVLWGDGTGKFDFENKSPLQINNELGFGVSLLGMAFSDFDKDGDVDVFLQTTRTEINGTFDDNTYYNSYILYLLENQGNRNFVDVTTSKIDGYYHIDKDHMGDMYEMMAIDKNDDGWIDIVPKDATIFCCYADGSNYVSNLWWENVGGSFVRRIENY